MFYKMMCVLMFMIFFPLNNSNKKKYIYSYMIKHKQQPKLVYLDLIQRIVFLREEAIINISNCLTQLCRLNRF